MTMIDETDSAKKRRLSAEKHFNERMERDRRSDAVLAEEHARQEAAAAKTAKLRMQREAREAAESEAALKAKIAAKRLATRIAAKKLADKLKPAVKSKPAAKASAPKASAPKSSAAKAMTASVAEPATKPAAEARKPALVRRKVAQSAS